jgi:predicted ester cyclase
MSEKNKEIVRKFIEEFLNKGTVSVVDEIFSPDFHNHDFIPGIPPDREGVKQNSAMMRSIFPDMVVTCDDVVAEGDKVAVRMTIRGTHKGEFAGIAPTGKVITFSAISITRIADGKFIERWSITDQISMLQQMGMASCEGKI